MKDKSKLLNHLAERTHRVFCVTKDGSDALLAERVAERIMIAGLPEIVMSNSELLSEVIHLATTAAGSRYFTPVEKKASRTHGKIERLVELLHDHDILDGLNMELSPPVAGGLIKQIETALGYRVLPRTDSRGPKQVRVSYEQPKLHAVHLAEAAANLLREHGVRVNSSKTGNLVKTLDAIKAATGFATNSRKSAAAVCGRYA